MSCVVQRKEGLRSKLTKDASSDKLLCSAKNSGLLLSSSVQTAAGKTPDTSASTSQDRSKARTEERASRTDACEARRYAESAQRSFCVERVQPLQEAVLYEYVHLRAVGVSASDSIV